MFLTFLLFAVAAGVLSAIATSVAHKKAKKLMHAALASLPDFDVTESSLGKDMKSGIAFDQSKNSLCLIKHASGNVQLRIVPYTQILSVELFQDGDSITKTSRSSQIGGALIGGLALGGVGAMIGGLSGKSRTSSKIKHIELRLTVDDTSAPLHDVKYLRTECSKDSQVYKGAIDLARRWVGIIDVLIKRAETDTRVIQPKLTQPLSASSVADEVKKLADLVRSGALTMDEFKQEKAKLLGTTKHLPPSIRKIRSA